MSRKTPLRKLVGSAELYWLATWFRPLFDVLRDLLVNLSVFPICLTLGLGVGAYHLLMLGRARQRLVNHVERLHQRHPRHRVDPRPAHRALLRQGLLNHGRNLGFTVAQAALKNGPITSGSIQPHPSPTSPTTTCAYPCKCKTSAAPSTGWQLRQCLLSSHCSPQRPTRPADAVAATADRGCGPPSP